MIQVQNITKEYRLGKVKINALKGITISLGKGEFCAIVGPSGSGKTTLLNIIGLLDKSTSGEVFIENKAINNLTDRERAFLRAEKIGFVFQNFNLIPVLNVYENIELALKAGRSVLSYRIRKDRLIKVIEEVGLKDHIRHKPAELSGGQRQRVAIARAIVKNPQLIIADEPTSNLDTDTAFSIIELMKRINDTNETAFLISTHDTRILNNMKKILTLKDGLIIKE